MNRYVESPAVITTAQLFHPTIFLAGGISNCPDWQAPMRDQLLDKTDLVVINPRRANWNFSDDREDSIRQITWEFEHLAKSDIVLFWFPCETLCPIALLELGKYLVKREVRLIIGTHPDYERRLDVEVQTLLERPGLTIHDNLEDMLEELTR